MKLIDLQKGWPSTSLFPKQELSKAAQNMFSGDSEISDEALIYGPDPGSTFVRQRLGEWLTRYYKPTAGDVSPDRLFIGNGASATLGVILDKFTDPIYTRRVWMIEPTYYLACPIFEDAGFEGRLRGVPEDEEGINLDFLDQSVSKVDEDARQDGSDSTRRSKSERKYPKLYRHVIYVVPTFSNPSGKIMSMNRRMQLVQLARKYDALLVTDDVYDMLRWPTEPGKNVRDLGPPPPRLVDIDRKLAGGNEYGNTCSNGSFSKIVAPGVRCSWVEGMPAFAHTLSTEGAMRSGGCPSQMTSVVMYTMVGSGSINNHLETKVIPTYQRRYLVMMDAIKKYLGPLGVEVTGGLPVTWKPAQDISIQQQAEEQVAQAGGFFCYIMFPKDLPTGQEIARIALKSYALKIAFGQMMVVAGDESSAKRCGETFGHGARLSWSWCTEEEISEGVQRLATVLKDIKAGTVS